MAERTVGNNRLIDGAKLDNLPADVSAELALKEDKVAGKGLSTEDYTTSEKNKLALIESGAEVNTLNDIIAGANISIDKTDPLNPIISGDVVIGDMKASDYDNTLKKVNVYNQDNMDDGVVNKNYTAVEKTKLAGIEDLAEVNQTDAEIKAQLENNPDTNTVTDAEKIVIGNTSGNNTGDQNAIDVPFDPSNSPLTKNNVQDELEELAWSAINTSVDVSPAIPYKIYIADTTTQIVTITLPDVSIATDNQEFKIIKSTNTNDLIVTTVSGVDLIGDQITQAFVETNTGFTVKANNATGKYEILQDSRSKAPTSSITFYATTVDSGVVAPNAATYNVQVTTTTDVRYDDIAVDASTGPIAGVGQVTSQFKGDDGAILGLVPPTTFTVTGQARKILGSGSSFASFYGELYHRTIGGVETLLGKTSETDLITNTDYAEFSFSGVTTVTQNVLATDSLIIKLIANRDAGGTDPSYELQVGGDTPARVTIAVPSGTISHDSLSGINQAGDGIVNGHISNVAQDIAGVKTFSNGILSAVNGVTLTNGGLATNFLQEDGNYGPAGGGGGGGTALVKSFIAGEAITAGESLYIDAVTGKVFLTDGTDSNKFNFIGFAKISAILDDPIDVYISGISDGFTGLTKGDNYYISHPSGGIVPYVLPGSSYTGNSYPVTQDTIPLGITFNNDGSKMYISGNALNIIFEYNLTNPFDLSVGVTYSGNSLNVTAQDGVPAGIHFNNDGTKLFILGDGNKNIYEYTLSVGFDLGSIVTYTGNAFSISAQATSPVGFDFNPDGTKIFVADAGTQAIIEYSLSIGFDLGSTVAPTGNTYSISAEDTLPVWCIYNDDGTRIFVMGGTNKKIFEYSLSIPYDLGSTVAYTGNEFAVGTQASTPRGLALSADGTKFFVVGPGIDTVFEYNFANPAGAGAPGEITNMPLAGIPRVGIATSATEVLINTVPEPASASTLKTATTSVKIGDAPAPITGQVLTAIDGENADWQTPGGGGGFELLGIATAVGGEADLTVTLSPTKKNLLVYIYTQGFSLAGGLCQIQFNGDTGITSYAYVTEVNAITNTQDSSESSIFLSRANLEDGHYHMTICNPSGSDKTLKYDGYSTSETYSAVSTFTGGGTWKNAAQITSIKIFVDARTFNAGAYIQVYGQD